ncbi:probable serine/threonine-protein kinase PIX13 [Tanacetum coccineum]
MNEFAPHRLPQPKGNMNGWLIEDEEEVERNEVDSDLESTASSKPVWKKTTKADHDRASRGLASMITWIIVDALHKMAPSRRSGNNDNNNNENPDIAAIIAQQLQTILPQIVTQVTNNVNNANNGNGGNGGGGNGNGGNNGCTFKAFQSCNPKEYDGKGGAIVLTRWIEKMENVIDNSGCAENQKVRYAASSLVNKALTWWNTQVQARGREAAMAMTWNDFKALMVEEFCPSNEMEKLENEFWNHKMVGANHAAYTDRFHELAKLVPHLVTPESSRIKRCQISSGSQNTGRDQTIKLLWSNLSEPKIRHQDIGIFEITVYDRWDGNNTFLDTTELPADYQARTLKEFEYDDLEKATKNFSSGMLLGEGGFGKVYLGWIDENTFTPSKHGVGIPVAVKRLEHESVQGHAEWQASITKSESTSTYNKKRVMDAYQKDAEVSFLGRLAHPNIVSLLGYCSNKHKGLLVYEYMANKSFDNFLFTDGRNAPNTAEPLSWGTRLFIMMGVARGLVYLHSSQNQVIYRDDFTAKLADFAFAKSGPKFGESHVTTRVMGTYGYAAPEYMATGHLYVKSDIYGFGVVLLETLTGLKVKDNTRGDEKHNLVEWARPILGSKRKLKKIMDPRLKQNYPLEGAFKCTALALRCLKIYPKDRPSSEEVLQSLEEIYAAKN